MQIKFNNNIPNLIIYISLQIYQVFVFTQLDIYGISKLQSIFIFPFVTSIILTSVYRHIRNNFKKEV